MRAVCGRIVPISDMPVQIKGRDTWARAVRYGNRLTKNSGKEHLLSSLNNYAIAFYIREK